MDLGLDLFRTTGRAARELSPRTVRELTEKDAAALQVERGVKPSALKRLSDRHHSLARNLAGGMTEGDAAIVCGLSLSRVSILKSDPAFMELLEFYRREVNLVYRDVHEKLSGVASAALDELQDRLEDEPEKVSIGQLIEVTKLGADRTGFGPSSTNVNVNVGLGDRLEAARKRIEERKKVIEHEPARKD